MLAKTIKASELPIDTTVLCWDSPDSEQYKCRFAKVEDGVLYAFAKCISWTSIADTPIRWKHMCLEDGTFVLPE